MSGPAPRRDASKQLAEASWLLRLIAKQMVVAPDGSAQVELPAPWVDRIQDFVAEQAPAP